MSGTDGAESLKRSLDRDPVNCSEVSLLVLVSGLYVTGGLLLPDSILEIATLIAIMIVWLRVVSYYLGRVLLFMWFPEISAREGEKYGKGSRSNK